mmetsp:Transcript_16292/g.44321  ORF Transcript_16292/g.44321 Transcript_16292/m.44321 type:complete len:234 (+) Transcript_16292:1667-2368(+)
MLVASACRSISSADSCCPSALRWLRCWSANSAMASQRGRCMSSRTHTAEVDTRYWRPSDRLRHADTFSCKVLVLADPSWAELESQEVDEGGDGEDDSSGKLGEAAGGTSGAGGGRGESGGGGGDNWEETERHGEARDEVLHRDRRRRQRGEGEDVALAELTLTARDEHTLGGKWRNELCDRSLCCVEACCLVACAHLFCGCGGFKVRECHLDCEHQLLWRGHRWWRRWRRWRW